MSNSVNKKQLLAFAYLVIFLALVIKPKIGAIDFNFLKMNSESVNKSTFPLYKKYNGEDGYNIFMLPGGSKYVKLLKNTIPENSVVLSDLYTSGHLGAVLTIRPIYAMPDYPDLSRFARFLLMHKLLTQLSTNKDITMVEEYFHFAGVEYILLSQKYINRAKRGYPDILNYYLNHPNYFERIYHDKYLHLFKVHRPYIHYSLLSKYPKELWRFTTWLEWDYFLESGLPYNAIDLRDVSAVSFRPCQNDIASFTFSSEYDEFIDGLSLLVDDKFVENINSIIVKNRSKQVLSENYSTKSTEKEGVSLIKIEFEKRAKCNGIKVYMKFKSDNISKIYDVSI